jgi:drug/metabolite transporter (DMT)-like permease
MSSAAARDHSRAVLQLAGAAVCWSFAGVLIKAVAATWPGLAVAGGRGAVAAIFLLITNRGLRFHFSRDQVIGALGYAACTITFCTATTMTSAANAILLQYTAPVWVALLGAALGGMALFFHGSLSIGEIAGDLLALLSGVCFAAMTIALRRQRDGSAVESIILGNALAFAVGLPWIITAPPLPPTGWAALLALGTVQLGVSYWLYARAIRHVTALEAVLIPVIEPVLNPVWVLIFVGEQPSGWGLAGGAIVLGAVTARAVASILARRRI